MEYELDCNEKRMLVLALKYNFDFSDQYRTEIKSLLEKEYENCIEGSSEYIRFLCGYLYCIGNREDLEQIKKVKYGIDMDVGTMIDSEWVESMENGYVETEFVRSRNELIDGFVDWYRAYGQDVE